MGDAAFAAIEGEIEAHDAHGLGLSDGEIFGAINRLPKPSH